MLTGEALDGSRVNPEESGDLLRIKDILQVCLSPSYSSLPENSTTRLHCQIDTNLYQDIPPDAQESAQPYQIILLYLNNTTGS